MTAQCNTSASYGSCVDDAYYADRVPDDSSLLRPFRHMVPKARLNWHIAVATAFDIVAGELVMIIVVADCLSAASSCTEDAEHGADVEVQDDDCR